MKNLKENLNPQDLIKGLNPKNHAPKKIIVPDQPQTPIKELKQSRKSQAKEATQIQNLIRELNLEAESHALEVEMAQELERLKNTKKHCKFKIQKKNIC